jgi:hypothetical protein
MAVGDDLSPGVIALAWILSVASTLVIALRLYVRLKLREKRRLSVDDYIIIVTWVSGARSILNVVSQYARNSNGTQALGIVNSIFVTIAAAWGLGKHQEVLADKPVNIMFAIKWAFLSEGPAIMAAGFSRISFAILLLSISPPSKAKHRFLWSTMVIQFVFDIAAVIVTYSQCQPIEKYWNTPVPGTCWVPIVQQYTGFVQGCK